MCLSGCCTARAKGRIWLRIGPRVLRNSGRDSRRAGPSAWAAGISRRDAGPSCCANRLPLPARRWVSRSVAGSSCSVAAERGLLARERRQDVVRGANEAGELRVATPELLAQEAEVGDHALDVLAALLESAADLGQVARDGLEALQGRRQLAAVVGQALAGRLEQELEEGAGVTVQGGEDLVRLDVGLRLASGSVEPSFDLLAAGARVDLDRHVLKARARAQQQGGIRMDEDAYLLSICMVTTARPLSSSTRTRCRP